MKKIFTSLLLFVSTLLVFGQTLDEANSLATTTGKPEITMKFNQVYFNGKPIEYYDFEEQMSLYSQEAYNMAQRRDELKFVKPISGLGMTVSLVTSVLFYAKYNDPLDAPSQYEYDVFYTQEERDAYDKKRENEKDLINYSFGATALFSMVYLYTYIHPIIIMKKSVSIYNKTKGQSNQLSFQPFVGVNQVGLSIYF